MNHFKPRYFGSVEKTNLGLFLYYSQDHRSQKRREKDAGRSECPVVIAGIGVENCYRCNTMHIPALLADWAGSGLSKKTKNIRNPGVWVIFFIYLKVVVFLVATKVPGQQGIKLV